jgi:hypothetical protein
MKIIRVTPMEEGLEDRTFECPKCHETDTLVFSAVSAAAKIAKSAPPTATSVKKAPP